MNAQRRKSIQEVIDQLTDLQSTVENLKDEEQEAYDNLPENLQGSERGEAMSEAADNLDSAYNSIDEVLEYLNAAIEG